MPYSPLHGPENLQLQFYTIMQDFIGLDFNCK